MVTALALVPTRRPYLPAIMTAVRRSATPRALELWTYSPAGAARRRWPAGHRPGSSRGASIPLLVRYQLSRAGLRIPFLAAVGLSAAVHRQSTVAAIPPKHSLAGGFPLTATRRPHTLS